MVVFKCILLFLIVFCIQGIHSKSPYDEQAEASGLGSILWGWVSYINPWGSSAGTIAPPKLEPGINSIRIKADSVLSRQMTAATIPVNTTAQEPTSGKSLERKVTTPIILVPVQISTTTEHFMEPKTSIIVKTSSENNPLAVKYSWKLLASSTPTAFVLDNPSTTEATISEQNVQPDALGQEIFTTGLSDQKESTISITSDLDDPTTTEEPETEQLLESESSTHLPCLLDLPAYTISALDTSIIKEEIMTDLLEVTPTEEPATEQQLEREVTTMSILPDIDNPITVEEPLKSEPASLNSQTVPDYQLEPELSIPSIVIVLDFPTSTEEIVIEQQLGPELSTTASALNDLITDVPTTNGHVEPEITTTFIANIAMDQKNTSHWTEEITTEHSSKEVTTVEDTLEVIVPIEAVSTATLSTDIEGTVFSGLYVTYMEADEPSITTELDMDPYTRLHEGLFKSVEEVSFLHDIAIDSSISLHEVMFKPVTNDPYPGSKAFPERVTEESTQTSEVSLLTELGKDPYKRVIGVIPTIDEESPERSNLLKPTERVTDLSLKVASVVSRRNKDLTGRSEGSILTETARNPYLGLAVVVSERNEETEGSEAILAEPVTHPYTTKIEEMSVSTEIVPNQFLQVEEAKSTGVKKSIEVNDMFRAVNDAMFTEKDEVIDVRVSRSHSGGFQLSFNHLRYMLLFYAVFMK